MKLAIISGLIVSTFAFALFQTIPDKIILLFGGSGDYNYIEFAKIAFRIYTLLIIGVSVQTPVGIFLQAIGKGGKSSVLSLSKQAIFPVAGMLLLCPLIGVTGVLVARPISDGLAFILSLILLVTELRSFGKKKQELQN